jgi:hypothetical protein
MKWTETNQDLQHLCDTSKRLWDALLAGSFQISVRLRDGRELTGRFSGSHAANNGGRDGVWQYCETVTLQTDEGRREEVDLLDIVAVSPAR